VSNQTLIRFKMSTENAQNQELATQPRSDIADSLKRLADRYRNEFSGARQATRSRLVRFLANMLETAEESAGRIFDRLQQAGLIERTHRADNEKNGRGPSEHWRIAAASDVHRRLIDRHSNGFPIGGKRIGAASMSDTKTKDYYRILEVPRSATAQQINAAYRALALKYHPDTSHTASDTVAEFRHITEAYDTLSDPAKRRNYDRLVRETRSTPTGSSTLHHVFDSGQDPLIEVWGAHTAGSDPMQFELLVKPEEARCGATIPLGLTIRTQCSHCCGSGSIKGRKCGACEGEGVLVRRQSISVVLPTGIENGSILRVKAASEIMIRVRVQAYW
jgi:DnaJ-domain-containing protein 1